MYEHRGLATGATLQRYAPSVMPELRLGTGIKEFDPQTLAAYREHTASKPGASS